MCYLARDHLCSALFQQINTTGTLISIEWCAAAIRETVFCDLLRVEWWFRLVLLANIPVELKQTVSWYPPKGYFPPHPQRIVKLEGRRNVTRDKERRLRV